MAVPSAIHDVISTGQEKAIIALVNEPTVKKAAESLGVSEGTLYRWMREPVFCKAYRDARRENFRHAIALTQRYAPAAVQALMKVMQDPNAGHAAKVSAATALLKFSRESIELDELAERIETLEATAQKRGDAPGSPTPPYSSMPRIDQAA